MHDTTMSQIQQKEKKKRCSWSLFTADALTVSHGSSKAVHFTAWKKKLWGGVLGYPMPVM